MNIKESCVALCPDTQTADRKQYPNVPDDTARIPSPYGDNKTFKQYILVIDKPGKK